MELTLFTDSLQLVKWKNSSGTALWLTPVFLYKNRKDVGEPSNRLCREYEENIAEVQAPISGELLSWR